MFHMYHKLYATSVHFEVRQCSLASGARMETSDKFRGEPAKGGEFGPEMLTAATKKGAPLEFEEGFRKLKEEAL